jgi:hypothetical protein
MQKVIKLDRGKFNISWTELHGIDNKHKIVLDFKPIIETFKLSGAFCLTHWQAKPFGKRRWGIYCSRSDNYYPTDYDQVTLPAIQSQLLQIDETKTQFPPSAVVYYPDCVVLQRDDGHLAIVEDKSNQ